MAPSNALALAKNEEESNSLLSPSPSQQPFPPLNGLLKSLHLNKEESKVALSRFQRFLQFETVSATAPTTGAYKECARFLYQELKSSSSCWDSIIYLPEAPDHSPVLIAHWKGSRPELPVIVLNSHYDVVPATEKDGWTVPPFQGIRKDGKIYGRGSQDMKCVCLQYMEAVRKLRSIHPKYQPLRSIYLTFVPDEEIGGSGMACLLDSTWYKSLPGIALALDEGLASTSNIFDVFYGERLPWWVSVEAEGPTGHGSRFIEPTAVGQLLEFTQKALQFRNSQRDQLEMHSHENCTHAVLKKREQQQMKKKTKKKTLGDVTTLNITTLKAGVRVGNTYAFNCVPPKAECSLDIRISPHMQPVEMKNLLDRWCRECSQPNTTNADPSGLSWRFIGGQGCGGMTHALTDTDVKINPWYGVFQTAMSDLGLEISPQVFPAATDSRFLRALGIRALGFSPMRNTEILLHENDEYIPESTYLEGIAIYVHLIQTLGSADDVSTNKKRQSEASIVETQDDKKQKGA